MVLAISLSMNFWNQFVVDGLWQWQTLMLHQLYWNWSISIIIQPCLFSPLHPPSQCTHILVLWVSYSCDWWIMTMMPRSLSLFFFTEYRFVLHNQWLTNLSYLSQVCNINFFYCCTIKSLQWREFGESYWIRNHPEGMLFLPSWWLQDTIEWLITSLDFHIAISYYVFYSGKYSMWIKNTFQNMRN